jgi:hypothetical protein
VMVAADERIVVERDGLQFMRLPFLVSPVEAARVPFAARQGRHDDRHATTKDRPSRHNHHSPDSLSQKYSTQHCSRSNRGGFEKLIQGMLAVRSRDGVRRQCAASAGARVL